MNWINLIPRFARLKRTALKRKSRKPQLGDDPAYLNFIRNQPCCICEFLGIAQHTQTVPHHAGRRGLRQKAPDRTALPLCSKHHDRSSPISVHSIGRRFWEDNGLDKDALIAAYNKKYDCSMYEAFEDALREITK